MDEGLARQFEQQRTRLVAIAYRMLGSHSDANDAVQEAWLRLNSSDTGSLDNLAGWLTTVLARVCLDMLRKRKSRREQPYGVHLPDPIVEAWPGEGPERQLVLAEGVGLALLVVLDTLSPAERLAFVLHDMFAVPFDTIATLLDRTPAAAKMLASRARHRVRGAPVPDADLARQREVVDAFFAATRDGDLASLVAVLAPDVVLRSEGGATWPGFSGTRRGTQAVAARVLSGARLAPFVRRALVNHAAGAVLVRHGRLISVMAFTVADGKIAAIDVLADAGRLHHVGDGVSTPR